MIPHFKVARRVSAFNPDRSQFHVLIDCGRLGFGVADFTGDRAELVQDIGSLQLTNVYRIFEFNAAESFAHDVTVEIAQAALAWREIDGREWNEELADLAKHNALQAAE